MGGILNDPPHPHVNISDNSLMSNIAQVDGLDNESCSSNDDINESDNCDVNNVTEYNTEDEIEPDVTPIAITPPRKPSKREMQVLSASSLPLVAVLNARSLYNKADNFKISMNELGIELGIVSESWEREEFSLEKLLNMQNYTFHSYKREKVKAKKSCRHYAQLSQ